MLYLFHHRCFLWWLHTLPVAVDNAAVAVVVVAVVAAVGGAVAVVVNAHDTEREVSPEG